MRFVRLTTLALVALCAAPVVARAQDASAMQPAEALMLTDPARAAAIVASARTAYLRADGAQSPLVALADHRLAIIRALGGDRAGQLRPMAEAAQRLAANASTAEQRTWAGQALIVAASFAMGSGEAALTDRLRDQAVALLDGEGLAPNRDLAEAYRVVSDVMVFQNRPREALAWADRSVALYERIDPAAPTLVYALARRGSALQRLSRYPEALADFRRALAHSDRGDQRDPVIAIFALRALGAYYWRLAEPDLALPLYKRALAEAKTLPAGFPYAGGLSRDIMLALLDADRFVEARAYAEETAARARAAMGPNSYEYASAMLVLARIETREGRIDDARRHIDAADAIFASGLAGDNSRRAEALAARGAMLTTIGRGGEAAMLYDRAGALLAHLPADDPERIDLAEGSAAARLAAGQIGPDAWRTARAAADGLTVRILRQAAGAGAIDTTRSRSQRVYGTALDSAWAQGRGLGMRR